MPEPKKDNRKKTLAADIPADLHARAKAKAALEGRPLQEVIEELVREWLQSHKEVEDG